jgi:hypothetical protein
MRKEEGRRPSGGPDKVSRGFGFVVFTHARFLAPPVKARGFGMTSLDHIELILMYRFRSPSEVRNR